MSTTNKRPNSPGAGNNLPRKRIKFSAHTRVVSPRKRRRGTKDERLVALQKLESRRRYPVFGEKNPLDTLGSIQPTNRVLHAVVPTVESQQPHQHCASPENPPSSPPDDYIGVDENFNNTHVQSGLLNASGVPRDSNHQTYHFNRPSSTWNIRRNNQATQWKSVVIPRLVTVYLANRAETESGRVPPLPRPPRQCECDKSELQVVLINWDRSLQKTLSICECYPASLQLVEIGYFPCAPTRPTLAVDINLLELVTIVSHHMAPNVEGWSSTLQNFLSVRGYLLGEKGTLRRRFGNALHWYQSLTATANHEVNTWIRNATFATSTPVTENSWVNQLTTPGQSDDRQCHTADDRDPGEPDKSHLGRPVSQPLPFPIPNDLLRENENIPIANSPSVYIQRRCPICFSSSKPKLSNSAPHVIVCVDANFAQRRRHSRHPDPVNPHPNTHFLEENEVEAMKRVVERARPSLARTGTMALPDETLDDCEKTFIAAQSHIAKTNNIIFADTALMALLCRHDRPLFLVNMTSAGERQYYALALIKALYRNLPDDWVVGLLYDVACQLERSMRKHNFLPEYIGRLTFAVSVFHAFGHQWACQLIYHPRKCKGFGLSDGEGSERLWSALRKMIPSLRSSGYWQRLFALDSHLIWFEQNNLLELGRWAQRKRASAIARKHDAMLRIQESRVLLEELEREWKEQVDSQTCSVPRQNINIADRVIADVLEKQAILRKTNRRMRAIERRGASPTANQALTGEIKSCQEMITSLEETIKEHVSVLGFTEAPKGSLWKFKGNAFLRLRMNALALRERIIQNLIARKFEMEKLERLVNFGNRMAHQDHAQVKQALNRRKGSHTRLVKSYEKLRQEMENMASQGAAPINVKIPASLANAKLWDLDVDDDLWTEIAQDAHFQNKDLPKWLCDKPTRQGIRAMLELQRCDEELERLDYERSAMHSWLQTEDKQLHLASCIAQGSLSLLYQVEQRGINIDRISRAWGMEIGISSILHLATPLYPENDLMASRSSSPASTDSHHDQNYVEDVWEELEATLQTKQADIMVEENILEDMPLDGLGLMSDAQGTSTIQIYIPLILMHQLMLAPPDFRTESPSPSIPSFSRALLHAFSPVQPPGPESPSPYVPSSSKLLLHPPSLEQAPDPDHKPEYYPFPSYSQAALPSKQVQRVGNSAGSEITRASPTGRFLACEDQIRDLINRDAWVHGAVINTLGDLFCYGSRSQRRERRYEILPTWLFDWWRTPRTNQTTAQDLRRSYSACFKEVASPVECRAWLVPALLDNHWYLLSLDWIDCRVRIYDSLATYKNQPPSQLANFGTKLVTYAYEDSGLGHQEWLIIPEQRGRQQKNGVDCGVYVLWDIYNLSNHGELRTQSSRMMSDWRLILHGHIQSLSPREKIQRSEREIYTGPIIDLDSD